MMSYRIMRLYSVFESNVGIARFCTLKHVKREIPGSWAIARFQIQFLRGNCWPCPCSAKFYRTVNLHRPRTKLLSTYLNKQNTNWSRPLSNRIPSSSEHSSTTPVLSGEVDRFGGLRICIQQQISENQKLLKSHEFLKASLVETVLRCRENQRNAVWLEVPAQYGLVIPIAAEAGFTFHHAEGNLAVMFQWLGQGESRIPDYATHQIGVSGFVLDEDSGRVLMIQDKHRIARWKFPGGYSKLGEDFSQTATREVLEETGISAEFQSILAFRQQHHMPYSFDRSDIYVVCRLKPLTFDITICDQELLDARWMSINDLLTSEDHTPLTRQVAKLANQGLAKSFADVDITMSELPSVYKGKTYKLFCRPPLLGDTA